MARKPHNNKDSKSTKGIKQLDMADKKKEEAPIVPEGVVTTTGFEKLIGNSGKWILIVFGCILAYWAIMSFSKESAIKFIGNLAGSSDKQVITQTVDEQVTVEIPLTSKWSTNFYGLVPEGASVSYYPDGCVVDYSFEQANSTITVSNQYPIGTANFQAINVDAWKALCRVSDNQPDELKKNTRRVLVVKYTRKVTITVATN